MAIRIYQKNMYVEYVVNYLGSELINMHNNHVHIYPIERM